jgi:hypothetical protein
MYYLLEFNLLEFNNKKINVVGEFKTYESAQKKQFELENNYCDYYVTKLI